MEEEKAGNKYGDHNIEINKPVRLSLHMIQRRNIPNADKITQEELMSALNNISHLRLDRENISEIDGLEILGPKVRNLYLQRNQITTIQNLECLKNLRFITLSGNKITRVSGLKCLEQLGFLDISENFIDDLDTDEFPKSIFILNLKDNPCTFKPGYRKKLIRGLDKLIQLDEVDVSRAEKIESGLALSDEEESGDDLFQSHFSILGSDGKQSAIDSFDELKSKAELKTCSMEMLMRSQERAENALANHVKNTRELDVIREESNILPSAQSNTPQCKPALLLSNDQSVK